MAVRTTDAKVRNVISTTVSAGAMIEYIGFASSFVDLAVSRSTEFAALGTTVLTQIETMLAAHFVATFGDPRALSEKYGKTEVRFQMESDLGYDASHYGQMALRIDPTGTLTAISKGTTGSIPAKVMGPG